MITVFGSINMDLIATTDRLPKPGETVAAAPSPPLPAARAPIRRLPPDAQAPR